MEIHVSSNDRNFVYNTCQAINENLKDLNGYACCVGCDAKNEHAYKVYISDKDVTDNFKKRITFGEMLDIMMESRGAKLYFQREDWIGTHNFVSLNNKNGRNMYLEIFHEDNRYDQYFDDFGIPIIDSIPYIPTYDDMLIHSWILYDTFREPCADEEE